MSLRECWGLGWVRGSGGVVDGDESAFVVVCERGRWVGELREIFWRGERGARYWGLDEGGDGDRRVL